MPTREADARSDNGHGDGWIFSFLRDARRLGARREARERLRGWGRRYTCIYYCAYTRTRDGHRHSRSSTTRSRDSLATPRLPISAKDFSASGLGL